MKNLYSLAINGEVVAENMKLAFAAIVAASLMAPCKFQEDIDEITIQRVSENDE